MMPSNDSLAPRAASRIRPLGAYALELCIIGILYFLMAKGGLALASINPSATPIWPATGLALAAVLIKGYRVWPAILLGAFAANLITAGSAVSSIPIAVGNTLEGVIGGWLINRWCFGCEVFATPGAVARFALISMLPTALSATIGVSSLVFAGLADPPSFGSIWLTWWLGDLAGALVVTPVIVLWVAAVNVRFDAQEVTGSLFLFAGTCVIGVIAFSPLIEQSARRAPLGFLAILPLLWAALRRNQRDTASVTFILSGFAVWATVAGSGPFAQETLNDSFLLLLMFMIRHGGSQSCAER